MQDIEQNRVIDAICELEMIDCGTSQKESIILQTAITLLRLLIDEDDE